MKVTGIVLLAATALLAPVRPPGLDFVHRNSPTEEKYLVETMGGGVALLDYDRDGLLDIFLVNGGRLVARQKTPVDYDRRNPLFWNRLYRQNRDGTFTDVTEAAGLSLAPNGYGMGAATGDFDNDGFPDLYVTNFGANELYRNRGDGTFADVTAAAGVEAGGWSVSAGFLDYDHDGRLDLFVSRYLDWDVSRNIHCGTPFWAYCRPDRYEGTTNLLFHNEGNGKFRDVSRQSGIAAVRGKGMGVAFNDYDGDGYTDICVSNDGMEQFLFWNRGDGTFAEKGVEAGVAYGDDGKTFAGMGVAFADYDNDGRPDIAVTNLALEKYALFRNEGEGRFEYASLASGLASLSARSSGWGVVFADFDNDGWKDLFTAQSHVLDNVERINPSLKYLEPPALFRNSGGKFERADVGTETPVAGRGAASGDLNRDGVPDIVMQVLGSRPLVLLGKPNRNHWLGIKLEGTASNRDGAGARIQVGQQWAYATTSGSYLSSSEGTVHFGLGGSTNATVEVVWPGGKKQMASATAVDRVILVKEPK